MILALGRPCRERCFNDDGSMALKKHLIRLLLREMMVSRDDDTQD